MHSLRRPHEKTHPARLAYVYARLVTSKMRLFMLCHETRRDNVGAPDSFIDCGQCVADELAIHNDPLEGPRETRVHAGHWIVCVNINLPEQRRLDAEAMRNFWRARSRKLHRRVLFAIGLARALNLFCRVDESLLVDVSTARLAGRIAGQLHIGPWQTLAAISTTSTATLDEQNTLRDPHLVRANETVCFTQGSNDAQTLSGRSRPRRAPKRSAPGGEATTSSTVTAGDTANAHVARRARLSPELLLTSLERGESLVAQPLALQAAHATALETALYSENAITRNAAAARVVAEHDTASNSSLVDESSPLYRIGRGRPIYEALTTNVAALCHDSTGQLDNLLLARRGDACYGDANELLDRRLKRVPVHWRQRCVCGSKNTLGRRVHLNSPTGRSTRLCSACGRTTRTSSLYRSDIGELRRRIGAPSIEPRACLQALADDADQLSIEEYSRMVQTEMRRGMPLPSSSPLPLSATQQRRLQSSTNAASIAQRSAEALFMSV